jgi:hypothetical protein
MDETWADWICGDCDTHHQLFLRRNDNGGRWAPTDAAQDMLEYHLGGACTREAGR